MADEKVIDLNRLSRFHDNLKSNGLPLNNWQANKKYKVGYTIIQDGKFYRCKTEHTSTATFDDTKFDLVGGSGSGISNWASNISYSVGNIVIYNDKIYKCIIENNDATFTPLNWVCLSATGEEDIGHITFGYELQSGYLPLDGSTYNRADYADLINWVTDNSLWASTSTDYGKFGTGDGTTTFTTPNFTGKFIECDNSTNVGGYTSAGLPNIKGTLGVGTGIVVDNDDHSLLDGTESFFRGDPSSNTHRTVSGGISEYYFEGKNINFNASRSSSIYSDSVNTVQPESIKLIPQIKYRKPNKSLPVNAVRRTLWKGEVGNLSNNSNVLTYIDIDDSFKNYDMLGFHITVTNNDFNLIRPLYREISTEDLSNLIVSQPNATTLSMCWGYFNNNDYCDIQHTSTNTRIQLALYKSQVTKVVGIKYINENQYSTEEQLVGTWIDGKPLYQKTLVKTGGVSNNTTYFNDELHNIDYLQKISASFITNINRYESEYNNNGNDKLQVLVHNNSNNVIGVYTLFASRTVYEMYVTVQYTKTTD